MPKIIVIGHLLLKSVLFSNEVKVTRYFT